MLRVKEVVIVEGRYDAAKLSNMVDGLILTTDGFSIFKDKEKQALIRTLGAKRGILLLTDSDAAGFKIRNYIANFAKDVPIKHAYIPALPGKESRKRLPSKEGFLGVEGVDDSILLEVLQQACTALPEKEGDGTITYTTLYKMGLSGTAGSSIARRAFLRGLGLPPRLSKKAMVEVLNSLYSPQELAAMVEAESRPVLFFDFHGTLVQGDQIWQDAAFYAMENAGDGFQAPLEDLRKVLSRKRLPWYSYPQRDTRHLIADDGWWRHCDAEFYKMFLELGAPPDKAKKMAPLLRTYITRTATHRLFPDTLTVLKTLRERGYRCFLISNNFPETSAISDALGIGQYLEGKVVSADIGFDKPRREIFEYARHLAGDPIGAVMIGDNPIDDIAGGQAAGFYSIQVNQEKDCKKADTFCPNLTALLDLFP